MYRIHVKYCTLLNCQISVSILKQHIYVMIVKTSQKKNNTKTVTSPKDLQYGTVMEGPLIPEIYVNLCTPVKFREHQMSRFYLNK